MKIYSKNYNLKLINPYKMNLNASNYSGNHLREKLSYQLENIVRKTQNNLEKGVYKNPNLTSINQLSPTGSRVHSRNNIDARNPSHISQFGQLFGQFEQNIEDPFFNYKHQQSQSSFVPMSGVHSPSGDLQNLQSNHSRPRTSQNWASIGQNIGKPQVNNLVERVRTPQGRNDLGMNHERSTSGLRDLSIELKQQNYQPLGSGAGVGEVNAAINSRYQMDMQLQKQLYTKLNENTNANASNIEQRQRIFEDIIIQRIKVIQNYCKKQYQKLKIEVNNNGGVSNPVILNSIHNDGMSLELKIKDIVKWRMEAYDERQKQKDEKQMQLEVMINRNEKQYKETVTAITEASQQEFDITNQHLQRMEDRLTSHELGISQLTEQLTNQLMSRVTANVTDTLLQSIMPQLDQQILSHIERVDNKNSFEKRLEEFKLSLNGIKSQNQIAGDSLSHQLQNDISNQQKSFQKQINDMQDIQDEFDKKIKKFNNELADKIETQESQIGKTNKQVKDLEKNIQMAEAKLVTEKQVKELIQENLQDQNFITKDKFEILQKQLQQQIDEYKMDFLNHQGDLNDRSQMNFPDYQVDLNKSNISKQDSDQVSKMLDGLEKRVIQSIQNAQIGIPLQAVIQDSKQAIQEAKQFRTTQEPKLLQALSPVQQVQTQVQLPAKEQVQQVQEQVQQVKQAQEKAQKQVQKPDKQVQEKVQKPVQKQPEMQSIPFIDQKEIISETQVQAPIKKKMLIQEEEIYSDDAKYIKASEQVSSQPVSSKPVKIEPVSSKPAKIEPVSSKPGNIEPVIAQAVVSKPEIVSTQAVSSKPENTVLTQVVSNQPEILVSQAVSSKPEMPVLTQAVSSKPELALTQAISTLPEVIINQTISSLPEPLATRNVTSLAPPSKSLQEQMITMGEIQNEEGSPLGDMTSSNKSSSSKKSSTDGYVSPHETEKLEMKPQSQLPVSKINRYQVSDNDEDEEELIENDDINLDMLEHELDHGSPPAVTQQFKPKDVPVPAPAPIVNQVPIDPADESWGVDSSEKEEPSDNFEPIIDEEFEPDTKNLKDKKKDEMRGLVMPKGKEEEKPSYIAQKVPLIDAQLWKKVPINISFLAENAIDNKINNMIEDVLLEYHNIEKNLYKSVKQINKEVKTSQKIKDLDIKNSINKISDLSELMDSKSMRDSYPAIKKADIPMEIKKKTNVFDDLDDLEDLMF